ncbi:MAG: PASTA domain-containing protein, partial [Gemmatimonadaceae bacterium]
MRWRGHARRFLPFIIAATAGFVLAYLVVAFVVFPAELIPDELIVPNVIGQTYDQAAQHLTSAGFRATAGESRFHVSAPPTTVLEQTPSPGSHEMRGTRVVLVVSGGQRTAEVPAVTGMARQDALESIRGAGFTVGSVLQEASDEARGQVIRSRPSGGQRVLIPSTVDIVLSSGPSSLRTPDVVGRSFAQARQLLEQLGLKVGAVDVDRVS